MTSSFLCTSSAGVGAVLAIADAGREERAGETAAAAQKVREGLQAPFLAAGSGAAAAAAANSELERARADDEEAAAIVEVIRQAEEEHEAVEASAARSRAEIKGWLQQERAQARLRRHATQSRSALALSRAGAGVR